MKTRNTHGLWFTRALAALALLAPARAMAQDPQPAPAPAPAADPNGALDPSAGPAVAPASPGAQCAANYEQAQTDKLAGRYLSAKAAALACSQVECNQAIVRECMQMFSQLEQDTPTMVVAARKAEGGELIDVRVEMDGKVVTEHITGRAFAVDPGVHEFVFIHAQRGRMQTTASARVGDHARIVEVSFADPNAKPEADTGAPGPQAAPERGVPTLTWVLGGVGLAAIGSFTYFRFSAVADYNDYNETCSPACNPDDVDKVRTKFLISNISLGVGAAALVGAGIVFAVGRGDGEPKVEASVTPQIGGAIAGVRTKF